MKDNLASIGTIEVVSLPDYGVNNVLAKIDTGADSSAIWASNISEKNGELKFCLFGPSSSLYSGEDIKTRKYSTVTVKNSFGHKESRYKISLRLKMADRVINTRITLANRTNNRFPILIGKRTIRGKFLVDVAKKPNSLINQRVLLLVAKRSRANQQFVQFTLDSGIDIKLASYDDLVFSFSQEVSKITISDTGEDIANFGLVYFRTSTVYGHAYVSATIAQYLEDRNVDFIDHAVNLCPDPAKLYQYIKLVDNNIAIPKTIFMLPTKMAQAYERLVAELGLPFILKDTKGSRGNNNFLIETKLEFNRYVHQANDLGVWLIAQQYIPNDFDYRLLVLGGQIALAIKRIRADNLTHLNNYSQGGRAEVIDMEELPSSFLNNAVASTKLLRLQVAGVDIIQDKKTKLWYCLEVNQAPQVYSGAFVDEKQAAIVRYLTQRLSN